MSLALALFLLVLAAAGLYVAYVLSRIKSAPKAYHDDKTDIGRKFQGDDK